MFGFLGGVVYKGLSAVKNTERESCLDLWVKYFLNLKEQQEDTLLKDL